MEEKIEIKNEIIDIVEGKGFSMSLDKMSFDMFFKEADEVLELYKKKISYNDMTILKYLMNSKELDFKNLSEQFSKSIYFHSMKEGRYVPFTINSFAVLLAEQDYNIDYLKYLFRNLEWNIVTKMKKEKDASFLYNIKFDNGTLISKNNKVKWINEKRLSFNNIYHAINITDDTAGWIKGHKYYNKLISYLTAMGGNNANYLIDILASIFLTNELTTAIFWIKSDGGKGKSTFFSYFTELLGGTENVSNLKIEEFAPMKNKENYKLPFLNGKIMNLDDDYSELAVTNTGFLKQFASGRNRIVVDVKQGQPISFYPKAQIIVLTNKDPVFKSFDSGDKRRNIVFKWLGEWDKNGIKNFDFIHKEKFKELFLTLLIYRAIYISDEIRDNPDVYLKEGYYLHNMPDEVRFHTDKIQTESSENCEKIKDYLLDGNEIKEFETEKGTYINVLATHKLFDKYLKEINEKMNYKDFLSALQLMEYISERPERIDVGTEGKRKQVYKRLK